MADSSVDITAGTGTTIDTRTEASNGHHRQVVVLGDPSTNAGVAPVDATNGLAVDVKAIAAGTNAIGKLAANSGVDIGDVDVTSVVPGTSASSLGKAEDAVAGSGDTGVMALAVRSDTATATAADGDYHPLLLDSAGKLHVNVGNTVTVASHAVTNAGTFAVQDATAQASLSVMDDWDNAASNGAKVSGDTAHDAADAGEPVKIGAKATNAIEGLTQVAANDRTNLLADLNGVLITRPYTTPEEILSERVSNTDGNSTAFSTFGAGGSGVHNYITTIAVYNSSATNGYIDLRDGTAGSIIFTVPLPTVGGSVITFPVPLKFGDNTAVAYDVSGALSTVYISVVGYQAQG